MSNEKMRQDFEDWFLSSGMTKFKETAFSAWEASRAALCVKLPSFRKVRHIPTPGENDSYNEAIENCKEAIESTGVRTK